MPTVSPIARRESREVLDRFAAVRETTERLCKPLSAEDCQIQSMADASPVKWHLAHTTWFFEKFLLEADAKYRPVDLRFSYLFNSYYNAVGDRHPRPQRGLISRPSLEEVHDYRRQVDQRLTKLLKQANPKYLAEVEPVVTLGLHHEQQHQELILTDVQHALSQNPLRPAYRDESPPAGGASKAESAWLDYPAGLRRVGHAGDGFAFDNEGPRHRVWLEGYQLAARLVTCGEFLSFMADAGYSRPELWLSDGWAICRASAWTAPLYWGQDAAGRWQTFSLFGMKPVDPAAPVCHVSYYEADAFARWASSRLPTEAEWEAAATDVPIAEGPEEPWLIPMPTDEHGLSQLDRDVWQWTASPYSPYPGYAPAAGALGEYNGKFMCNQFVLRGGSCATARSHVRRTYRNFFPPEARWQFSGFRLARDR
jgi:ergothioneine biosynthesis protein EgtB